VLVGSLGSARWVLKPSSEDAVANEIIASVIGRSLGLNVPPAMAVDRDGGLWAASLLIPDLEHRAPFNNRNPLYKGPDGPEDIHNYWPQAALGKLLGDIDRKGGNWGVSPDGARWDFDYSLSANSNIFVAPDNPDWYRQRQMHLRDAVEWAARLSPHARERYLEPFYALAESDPEALYGWASGVGDLGGIFMGKEALGPALIEAGHANRRAVAEALKGGVS
jgi:hypothetical protein